MTSDLLESDRGRTEVERSKSQLGFKVLLQTKEEGAERIFKRGSRFKYQFKTFSF